MHGEPGLLAGELDLIPRRYLAATLRLPRKAPLSLRAMTASRRRPAAL
jgi:hypothetical protein